MKNSNVAQLDNLLLGIENGWLAAPDAEILGGPARQANLRKVGALFASRLSEKNASRALVVPRNLAERKRMVSAIMAGLRRSINDEARDLPFPAKGWLYLFPVRAAVTSETVSRSATPISFEGPLQRRSGAIRSSVVAGLNWIGIGVEHLRRQLRSNPQSSYKDRACREAIFAASQHTEWPHHASQVRQASRSDV